MLYTSDMSDYEAGKVLEKPDWSTEAIRHNSKQFGAIEVVTEEWPEFKAMAEAAVSVYGEYIRNNWRFKSLANYLAMRRFLSGRSSEMIWIESDMVRNPNVPFPKMFGVCETMVWGNSGHTPTDHEIYKKAFCEAFVTKPVRPYNHMMSSWMRLERRDVEAIVAGLHSLGLDLLKASAWEKIQECELKIGATEFRLFSDMVLELSWMASFWVAGNVFDMLGLASYQEDYETKPIIHFDDWDSKQNIIEYLKTIRR